MDNNLLPKAFALILSDRNVDCLRLASQALLWLKKSRAEQNFVSSSMAFSCPAYPVQIKLC